MFQALTQTGLLSINLEGQNLVQGLGPSSLPPSLPHLSTHTLTHTCVHLPFVVLCTIAYEGLSDEVCLMCW
jgi:hypothetical protein